MLKLANILKKHSSYFIISISIIISLSIMFFLGDMYPFGSYSNLAVDFGTQYVDFILFFKNSSLQDLLYSFTKGFGGQTIGLAAYYMLSPFNFIAFLFDDSKIQLASTIIFYAKFIFIGVSANCYLSKHYKKGNIPFAVMYALCPYFVLYFFNIIWLDAFAIFPLLLIGCEKIIDDKKIGFFTFWYTASLIINYYISYMSSLFILLYFFYYYFINYKYDFKFIKNRVFLIARSVITSAFLSAPILIPTLINLQGNKLQEQSDLLSVIQNPNRIFNPLLTLSNIFSGNFLIETVPFVFFTVSSAFLLTAYFTSKKYSKKEKFLSFAFISFMVISFLYNLLYVIWHAMAFPQGFNYRFYFTYIFLLIIIMRKGFESLNNINYKYFFIGLSIIVLPSYAFYFFTPHLPWGAHTLLFTTTFLVGLLICLYLNYKQFKYAKFFLAIIILANIIFDSIFIFSAYSPQGYVFYHKPHYEEDYNTTKPIIDYIDTTINDDSFYRLEDLSARPYNQPMAFDYYGVSHFSSTFDPVSKEAFIYFGFENTFYSQQYTKSMPEVDSFFSIKYLMAKNDLEVSDNYTPLYNTDYKTLYENPYSFPIVYKANDNMPSLQETKNQTLDMIFKNLGASDDLYLADGQLNYKALEEASLTAQSSAANITYQNANIIEFNITANKDEKIFTTIPYDASWYIFCNGERVSQETFIDYFLSIDLNEGYNEFYMIYIPKGLIAGSILCILTITTLIIEKLYILKKHSKLKSN